MKYIATNIAERDGKNVDDEPITLRQVNEMYSVVNDLFLINDRDVQKQWLAVVCDIRKRNKDENRYITIQPNNEECTTITFLC